MLNCFSIVAIPAMVAKTDAAKEPGRFGKRHCHQGCRGCGVFGVCFVSVCVWLK